LIAPPWSVEQQDACFVVRDHDGQPLAYVYFPTTGGERYQTVSLCVDWDLRASNTSGSWINAVTSQAALDAERRQAMSLLIRYLNDVFGENDPARRRAAIDEIFHEDAVYYDRNGAYRGRDEIHRIAGVIKAGHPDFRYQPIVPPEELGNGGRVRWGVGSPWSCAILRRD
jgi:SnoaL-like domain